ncbi:MAG TPA: LysE family translocator [Ramlibacter sp.]|uniref:LysE family translocator n=1 Tax=Ramlibacter sp. TaxID=1917967 RepID=UPI002C7F6BE6|nr:LysE family translocator [Ramlibacter sp.]HVZ46196.1 LysE family translocator [Ramlibacter sp.]
MPDAQNLLLFMAAGWLLNLAPGPDVLYIVSHSLRSGAKAGLAGMAGILAGCFVHVAAAAVGVSALLAASAAAFAVLKWAGAAYLLWVGVRLLIADRRGVVPLTPGRPPRSLSAEGESEDRLRTHPDDSAWPIFRGGFLTNALNPKVALFFLAFVPQFIAPDTEHKALAFVLLGVLFIVNSIPINAGWALAAAWMARRDAVQRGMHWLDRAAGVMFIGFGIKLAMAQER